MKKINRVTLTAMALALLISLLGVSIALAHEQRTVGKYDLLVGWENEPALVGLPNGIFLSVTNNQTKQPVDGLEKTLKVQVTFGGRTMPIDLNASDEKPGVYTGDLIPTRAGSYIFHLTGNLEETPIDEKFESGPGRFDDVADSGALQFPDKLPSAADIKAAQDTASNAQTLGLIGVVTGILGLVVGGIALFKRR